MIKTLFKQPCALCRSRYSKENEKGHSVWQWEWVYFMLNCKTPLNDSETNTSTAHIEIPSGKVWPAKKGHEKRRWTHPTLWTSGHGLEVIKIGLLHVARICCKPSIRPLQQPLESSQQSLTSSWTGPLGRPATRRPLQQVEAIKQNHRSQVGKIRILEKVCCLLSPEVTICATVHGQKMAQSYFDKERKKERNFCLRPSPLLTK